MCGKSRPSAAFTSLGPPFCSMISLASACDVTRGGGGGGAGVAGGLARPSRHSATRPRTKPPDLCDPQEECAECSNYFITRRRASDRGDPGGGRGDTNADWWRRSEQG